MFLKRDAVVMIGAWLLLLLHSVCAFADSAERRGERIPLTMNSLTEAKFYSPRRKFTPHDSTSSSQLPQNGVHAICEHGKIGLKVSPLKEGRVFASHKLSEPECIQFTSPGKEHVKFTANINSPCGIKIVQRDTGVEYRLRVVVSHSKTELLEEDRIYDIVCKYALNNATVSAAHDTVGLRAGAVRLLVAAPQCKYSLHLESSNGPQAVSARIGARVYHKWSCASPEEYAFRVYACSAHNGLDKAYTIVDEKGCSLDEKILPQLEYDLKKGVAYAQAKAFRLANSRRIHFNCLVAICHRWDKQCMKDIPPKCTSRSPKKRDLPRIQTTEEEETGDEQFSLSTEDIQLSEEDCGSPWLIILCISNVVTLFISFIACAYFHRRQLPPKTPRHFKF